MSDVKVPEIPELVEHICGFLDNDDLETCCQVNSFWSIEANKMFITCYTIEVNNEGVVLFYNRERDETKSIFVLIKPTDSPFNNNDIKLEYSFQQACNLFQKKKRISFELSINIRDYYNNESIKDFLSKYGYLVSTFSTKVNIPMDAFCEHIVKYFPNIECLELTYATFGANVLNFNSNLPENQLKNLKTIYSPNNYISHPNLVALLSVAPNLEKFYNFNIMQWEALVITQKAKAIKSLRKVSLRDRGNGEPYMSQLAFQSALCQFALLKPKLTEFSFEIFIHRPDIPFLQKTLNDAKRIMRSSHDSIERLSINPFWPVGYEEFSSFPAHIQRDFFKWDQGFEFRILYDEGDFPIPINFPKVKVMEFEGYDQSRLLPLLRENVFSPYGPQIEELYMKSFFKMGSDTINLLGQTFPSVKVFQINVESMPRDLERILPAIANNWPAMESITVKFCGLMFSSFTPVGGLCSFESVLTGIPDQILNSLKNEAKDSKFYLEEMYKARDNSALLKMPSSSISARKKQLTHKLQTLEVDFTCCDNTQVFLRQISKITSVSRDCVFKYHPDLKFVFHLKRGQYFSTGLRDALSPILKFEFKHSE